MLLDRKVSIMFAEIGLIGAIFNHTPKKVDSMPSGKEKVNLLRLRAGLASTHFRMKKTCPFYFVDHKKDIEDCINLISSKVSYPITPQTSHKIILSFCYHFLKHSPSKYSPDITESIKTLMAFYKKEFNYEAIFSEINFKEMYSDLLLEPQEN